MICSCNLVNASTNNRIPIQNRSNNIRKSISYNSNNINHNSINIREETNDNYAIAINTNNPLTKTEIEEFFDNLKNDPSALINAKYQLYSIECKYFKKGIFDILIEYLYKYFEEISKSKINDLNGVYSNKLSQFSDDIGIQIIMLINECLNNPNQQIKHSNLLANANKDTLNYATIIYNNIVTKIIRGVNLISNFTKAKKYSIKHSQDEVMKNKSNVISFSNQKKCWFMSYFSFLIAMCDSADINDPIHKTNFGKFVNYLHNKQQGFTRKVHNDNNEKIKLRRLVQQDKYTKFDYLQEGKWQEHMSGIGYNEWALSSTNVVGERIDLISELITWCSEHYYFIQSEVLNGKEKFLQQKKQQIEDLTMKDWKKELDKRKKVNQFNINDLEEEINERNVINNIIITLIEELENANKINQNITTEEIQQKLDTQQEAGKNIINNFIYNLKNEIVKRSGIEEIKQDLQQKRQENIKIIEKLLEEIDKARQTNDNLNIRAIKKEKQEEIKKIDNDILLIKQELNNISLQDSKPFSSNTKERIRKSLHLLEELQDLNYGVIDTASAGLMIILNLFPELKEFIGNGPAYALEKDAMIACVEGTLLDENSELKKYHDDFLDQQLNDVKHEIGKREEYIKILKNAQNKIINTNFNKHKEELQEEINKLESELKHGKHNLKFYTRDKLHAHKLYYTHGHANVLMNIENGKVFSNKPYVLFKVSSGMDINKLIQNYRYITHYNQNGELEIYEPISILLSNGGHSVCFSKTGKSDKSWSGIDSSLGYNDDNYSLDDIIYDSTLVEKDNNGKLLDKNKYLSKMYNVKNDGIIYKGQRKFSPHAILYKKIFKSEINLTINKMNLLDFFNNFAYNIINKNAAEVIEKFKSNSDDNALIEFCKSVILTQLDNFNYTEQQKEIIRSLIQNTENTSEVNDSIHNNIYYIVKNHYIKLWNEFLFNKLKIVSANSLITAIPDNIQFYYDRYGSDWFSHFEEFMKEQCLIEPIENKYRKKYITMTLHGILENDMTWSSINNTKNNKYDCILLSSINTKSNYDYFSVRNKYSSTIFSNFKKELATMNPSWNYSLIMKMRQLIDGGYITNPDIINYIQDHDKLLKKLGNIQQ